MASASSRGVTLLVAAVALTLGAGLSACGGGSSGPPIVLSAAGKRGKAVAEHRGCFSCHNATGPTLVGPTWKGVAGSTVTLSDGSKVTADDAYLTRAITQARSEVVKGYRNVMPEYRSIPAGELADLLAYLHDLSPTAATTTTTAAGSSKGG